MAQREVWQATITDTSGNIVPGVQITVYEQDGITLATIYGSLTDGVKPNPFIAGTDGVARFYAESGRYVVRAFKGSQIAERVDVDLSMKALREDLAAIDSDVLIAGFPAREFNDKINELQSDFDDFIDDSQQDVDQFINDNQNAITRSEAEKKLKRNASFFADFTKDEAITVSGLTKTAQGVADAITYTAADGISGQGADGKIYTVGANTPAIVWNQGECQGLQVAPASTNLLTQSQDLTSGMTLGRVTSELSNVDSPVIDKDSGLPVKWALFTETNESGVIEVRKSAQTLTAGIMSVSFVIKPISARYAGFFIRNATQNIDSDIVYFSDSDRLNDGSFYAKSSITLDGTVGVNAIRFVDANGATVAGGQGVDAFYMTALQQEVGYPTPYIKTEESQVTRDAAKAITTLSNPLGDQFSLFFHGRLQGGDGSESFHGILSASPTSSSSGAEGALAIFEDRAGERIRCTAYNTDGNNTNRTLRESSVYQKGGEYKLLACVDKQEGILKFFSNGMKVGEATGIAFDNPDWSDLTKILQGAGLRYENDQGNGQQQRQMDAVLPYCVSDAEAIALTTLEDE